MLESVRLSRYRNEARRDTVFRKYARNVKRDAIFRSPARDGGRKGDLLASRLITPCYFLTIAGQYLNIVQRAMNLTFLFNPAVIYERFINNILLLHRFRLRSKHIQRKFRLNYMDVQFQI